jgi:quercetin dioxygenase-like cupin family protein
VIDDPAPILRRDLLTAVLGQEPPIERVQITRVQLAPGQAAGRHLHPCHVIGCVLEGAINFQIAGEAARSLEAGDAFHEPSGVEIAHFDNAAEAAPAVFIAAYLLPPGETRLIVMLDRV